MTAVSKSTSPGPMGFPGYFWVANVLEIFERMGWYGFYAVSSLYLTGSVASGGLGMTSADRGVIQALVTFLLYLFPAFFGALADRYGYKKMFMASFMVMAPGYLVLQFAKDFWSFFLVYTFVAIGHGMFKPVVVATVAKASRAGNGSMAFGIFYMMVNIGGFLGPIAAGIVRGWGWHYVFYASAIWCAINLVWCGLFYREPQDDAPPSERKTMRGVLRGMIEVVGNVRFFVTVFGSLMIMVLGSKWIPWPNWLFVGLGWIAVNFLLDVILRAVVSDWRTRPAFTNPVSIVGEGRYLVFLLLMAGFWTSFNQLFITVPEYIRDYTDTTAIANTLDSFLGLFGGGITPGDPYWFDQGKIKPEYLINLNAFGIICLQVLISYLARNIRPLNTIVSGIVVTILSFLVFLGGAQGWFVVLGILVFSVGEMLASPKAKEYAGLIAPPGKTGMYMGYFYWCNALGNLFGGILSGQTYQYFGPAGIDNPDPMWWIYSGAALVTAVGLLVYNRAVGGGGTTR